MQQDDKQLVKGQICLTNFIHNKSIKQLADFFTKLSNGDYSELNTGQYTWSEISEDVETDIEFTDWGTRTISIYINGMRFETELEQCHRLKSEIRAKNREKAEAKRKEAEAKKQEAKKRKHEEALKEVCETFGAESDKALALFNKLLETLKD